MTVLPHPLALRQDELRRAGEAHQRVDDQA